MGRTPKPLRSVAIKSTRSAAEAHFKIGGSIVIVESPYKGDQFNVTYQTVVLSKPSWTWDEVWKCIVAWSKNYPDQTFYIVKQVKA